MPSGPVLRHGPTRCQFRHNQNTLFLRHHRSDGYEKSTDCNGSIFLAVLWQLSQVSRITTSIVGSDASFLNPAVIGVDKSYSNSLFTEGRSSVVKVIDTRTEIQSDLLVKSSGPFGVDEYWDQTGPEEPDPILNCVFYPVNTSNRYSEFSAVG